MILLQLAQEIEDSRMQILQHYGIELDNNDYQIPSDKIQIANKELEDLFSLEDKDKIGINTDNYKNEKAAESLSLLGKIQNGIEKLSEEAAKESLEAWEELLEVLEEEDREMENRGVASPCRAYRQSAKEYVRGGDLNVIWHKEKNI